MSAVLNNIAATTAPTAADDVQKGYSKGSVWHNTNVGNSYVCRDATANAAVWIPLGSSSGLIWPSGLVLKPANMTSVTDFNPGTADRLFFLPFFFPRRVTTSVAILAQTATAGSTGAAGVFGIYAPDPNTMKPASKLWETGQVSLTGSGSPVNANLSNTWDPGLYWGCLGIRGVTTAPSMTCIGNVNGQYVHDNWAFDFSSPKKYYTGTKAGDFIPAGVDWRGSNMTTTGNLTNGSAVVSSLASTTGFIVGMTFSSTVSGIPAGTTIASVDSTTQITMSAAFTGTTTTTASVTAGALNFVYNAGASVGSLLPNALTYSQITSSNSGGTPLFGFQAA